MSAEKVCKKCSLSKDVSCFRERKKKNGTGTFRISTCHDCELLLAKDYRNKHQDLCKKRNAEWKRKNKQRNREHSRKSYSKNKSARQKNMNEWKAKNREKYLLISKQAYERHRDEASDSYVRSTLGYKKSQCNERLIQIKRSHILMIRELKKLNNLLNSKRKEK